MGEARGIRNFLILNFSLTQSELLLPLHPSVSLGYWIMRTRPVKCIEKKTKSTHQDSQELKNPNWKVQRVPVEIKSCRSLFSSKEAVNIGSICLIIYQLIDLQFNFSPRKKT